MATELTKIMKAHEDILISEKMKEKFSSILKENSASFMNTVLNLIKNNNKLQECDGFTVWNAAMTAATLKLSIDTDFGRLKERADNIPDATPADIFTRIYNGGMPQIIAEGTDRRDRFYESYIRTYIERDVRDLSGDIDVLKFHRFMVAAAARTAQLINFKSIADDAEIDQITAKNWLNILETLGLIFYLHPYSNNLLKRTIKSPKLYFYDSGLAAYLARWNGVEALMNGAQARALLENFVVSEVSKGYHNSGLTPYLNYFRDKDNKEIDLLWESNGTLYPLEIKKTSNPDVRLTKVFSLLEKSEKILGSGGIVCLYDSFMPFNKNNFIIPIRCV